ncbi:MAG: MBL fold metallo-hydrolase [Anaerolineales bacterium]|nr:MBL fold metallo-hydrolase [Anaerolineales bacterium]
MLRERVADNIYVFTSELYAQVNAGAVVGPEWSVLIDTLPYPEETKEIRELVEGRLGSPVRYIINTHHHPDHVLGNCFFPQAVVIGHALCRQLMDTSSRARLEAARRQSREVQDVELVLPSIVFSEGSLILRVGRRTLELISLPGHSPDGIGVLITEDHVLFAGDAMMPMPYLVDGDSEQLSASLRRIPKLKLENLVQGHGEIILRGEIQNALRSNLNYLTAIERGVSRLRRRRNPQDLIDEITIEDCGKSRILLGGNAPELHRQNVLTVLRQVS